MIKILYKDKIYSKLILAIAAFLSVVIVSCLFWQPAKEKINSSFAGKQWFSHNPILTKVYRIFDLGAVDVNLDGNLDIFTSNHNHGQYLLLGDGKANFSDSVASDWGLDQDRDFPGLEYDGTEPTTDRPGLYIYWKERNLIIRNYQDSTPVKGKIDFFAKTKVKKQTNFDVKVEHSTIDTGAEKSEIEFVSTSDTGTFNFNPGNVSLPITIELDPSFPLDKVYIGNLKNNPTDNKFSFYLRDRHGMAWTDYDRSGKLDVFIVRGGLKGRMGIIPEKFNDELLVNRQADSYQEAIADAQIEKQGCPALQTTWVDINSDDLLDLYTVCYRGAKDDDTKYRNQLYQQQIDGTFSEIAASANLDFTEMGFFNWLDVDEDGDRDLLWINDDAFWLYKNEQGKFIPTKIADNPGKVWENFEDSTQITLADYDSDGDIDIFAALPTGNNLLVNNGGNYQLIEPAKVGLPSNSLVANWVDYDNDGLADLHTIPHGLYHQEPNHQFIATEMLASKSKALLEARATWFDAENNGTRDLILATRYEDSLYRQIYKKLVPQATKTSMWQMVMYPNMGSTNHWLEIDLVGNETNPQALGSKVQITTPSGVQTAVVGQSEGSQFSQGHYRLYFGLGKQAEVSKLKIFWSDGYTEEIEQVASDRLLTINRDRS